MPVTLDAPQRSAATREDDLAPLVFFYGIGSARPRVTFVEPEELPDQERWLLVHDIDMTPRLREGHGCEIDLDVHARARIGNYLVRASVLNRRSDGKPVEFGAILEQYQVPHSSHPRGFFRIAVDARLAELLGATSGQILFGRCNELRHDCGRVLADVVEVLPRGL